MEGDTVRILTTFHGARATFTHDSVTGRASDDGVGFLACSLAQFLEACNRQRQAHRELGLRYRITQEIRHDAEDVRPEVGLRPDLCGEAE